MSTSPESKSPETELDLDLHFLPSWAQKPADTSHFAKYTGSEESGRGGRGFGERRDRGPGGPGGGQRRDRPPQRREGGPGGGGGRPGGQDRGPRPGQGQGRGRPQFDGPRREERREPIAPLPDLEVTFIPEEKGVESLARQIKLTGRAYPLFEIATLVLKKAERYSVQLNTIKKPDGQVAQPLFICGLDDTLWLSEQDAVEHVLGKHFGTFYSSEKIPTDPPKGTYTFVAQCGMSGAILGPPNYHDYQAKLAKLHADRFSRMPFDMFKSRIKMVREPEVVKKWLDEQSFRTEFTALNIPESIKINSREEVDTHFRQTHLANVVLPVDKFTMPGTVAQSLPARPLQTLIRRAWDDQMRFPLKIVNVLSGQFARHGLQFFKVNKTVTHVAIARPKYLDMALTPVSENVKKIVDFIDATPKCTRRKLIEAFAPGHSEKPAAPAAPAAEPAAGTPAAPTGLPEQPTPEMAALVSDLHWLIHEGHVIEFANGIMETAKRPLPKPVRVEKPKAEAKPGGPAIEATAAPESLESAGEVTSESVPNIEGPTGETSHSAEAPSAETPAPKTPTETTPAA
jgi:hypothetical protein